MGARRYGISLRVFNLILHELDIKLTTRREIPYLQAAMYYFVYYINILMTTFLGDFPKISERFPKISGDSPKVARRPDKRFRTFSENFQRFPKITEDFRG